jgi:hypothetical protein
MAIPVLDDYQFQFGDDGVLLNGDNNGIDPFVDVDKVDGLDSATFRTSEKDIEGWNGSVVEAEFESKRTIVLGGTIYGVTHTQMESYIDRLKANFAPSTEYKPFYFKAPGVAMRRSMVKSFGFRSTWDAMRRLAIAKFQVTLTAGDTIIYGVNEYLYSGNFANAGVPGFSFPFAFPFDFGVVAGSTTGLFNASHNGNRPAPFIARFRTATTATDPGLRHEGLGLQVSFDTSLTLGDELVVDFGKQKVHLNGSPRRGSVMREGWFGIQPGVANPLRLLVGSGEVSVTLSMYDAWR